MQFKITLFKEAHNAAKDSIADSVKARDGQECPYSSFDAVIFNLWVSKYAAQPEIKDKDANVVLALPNIQRSKLPYKEAHSLVLTGLLPKLIEVPKIGSSKYKKLSD